MTRPHNSELRETGTRYPNCDILVHVCRNLFFERGMGEQLKRTWWYKIKGASAVGTLTVSQTQPAPQAVRRARNLHSLNHVLIPSKGLWFPETS